MENQSLATQCQADGAITITSGQCLTIGYAVDFARFLREAMTRAPVVAVELAAGMEVDVTALQVLCSACKTAAIEGKGLSLHGPGIQALRELIAAAGAERPGPCTHNHNHPCLWFGGEQ